VYMSGSGASAEYKDRHETPGLRVGIQSDGRRKRSSKKKHTEAHTSQATKEAIVFEEIFLNLWVERLLHYPRQFFLVGD
jgi:hypothetical protein